MSEHTVILLAEDREDDIVLIRRAFDRAQLRNPLFVVRDGEEVIEYLVGTGKYINREEYPLPGLILLDLKMPRTDGFQVLQWIRSQPSFRNTAVVVLTSSDQVRDVNLAYTLGANSFLVKPGDFENYLGLCRIVRDYWMNSVRLPQTTRPDQAPSSQKKCD